MKDPMSFVNRFCSKHPNFGIENLMRYVAISSAVFWLVSMVSPRLTLYLVFNAGAILHGQIWRLVTFFLMPTSSGPLALISIYFYYWIGNSLEKNWGSARFTIYFFSGIILTALYGFIIYFVTGASYEIGASYVYLSMFFSFATLFPDMTVLLMFILPIKIKYLAYVDAALFVYSIVTTPFPGNLLPLIAVLNFLIFCWGDLSRLLPRKPSKSTVNFRRESQRIRHEQSAKLYTHKCSVCGITDADRPDMEFRYCSRCAGYHCFCEEHINNHIHFTE